MLRHNIPQNSPDCLTHNAYRMCERQERIQLLEELRRHLNRECTTRGRQLEHKQYNGQRLAYITEYRYQRIDDAHEYNTDENPEREEPELVHDIGFEQEHVAQCHDHTLTYTDRHKGQPASEVHLVALIVMLVLDVYNQHGDEQQAADPQCQCREER